MTSTPDTPPGDAARSRHLPGRNLRFVLATIPWVGMLVVTPFVNRVEPFVFGMPFLLFWIVLCVVLTSVCMGIVYLTDPRNKPGGDPDEPLASAAAPAATPGSTSTKDEGTP